MNSSHLYVVHVMDGAMKFGHTSNRKIRWLNYANMAGLAPISWAFSPRLETVFNRAEQTMLRNARLEFVSDKRGVEWFTTNDFKRASELVEAAFEQYKPWHSHGGWKRGSMFDESRDGSPVVVDASRLESWAQRLYREGLFA